MDSKTSVDVHKRIEDLVKDISTKYKIPNFVYVLIKDTDGQRYLGRVWMKKDRSNKSPDISIEPLGDSKLDEIVALIFKTIPRFPLLVDEETSNEMRPYHLEFDEGHKVKEVGGDGIEVYISSC